MLVGFGCFKNSIDSQQVFQNLFDSWWTLYNFLEGKWNSLVGLCVEYYKWFSTSECQRDFDNPPIHWQVKKGNGEIVHDLCVEGWEWF